MNLRILRIIALAAGLIAVAALEVALACDTWVAMRDVTQSGSVMLGKNSDRPTFGCQPLVFNGREEWPPGSEIDLGRIKIPQVDETFATLGSSPYWCWGYEEGMNEFGVAIGNEGVWTKPLTEAFEAYAEDEGPEPGPTGMDFLRLGLERGRTAREALDIMTALLEQYGQFGSGVPGGDALASYDNSYIIADAAEAYILETAGRKWVARRVSNGSASISNRLSIETEWDLASPGIIEHAIDKGWWEEAARDEFSFRSAYMADGPGIEERDRTAHVRQEASCSMLMGAHGAIDVGKMKEIGRDQSSDPSIDLDQTASSCVAVLRPPEEGICVFWWCASRPSNGCFVPFFVEAGGVPEAVASAGTFGKRVVPPGQATPDEFSADSYWWLFRDLTDMVNADRAVRQAEVRTAFDALESEFEAGLGDIVEEAQNLKRSGDKTGASRVLSDYTASCVDRAVTRANELREHYAARAVSIPSRFQPYVGIYTGNFGPFEDAEFEVRVQNDRLAIDVPGQMVFELLNPDAEGRWYFALSPLAAVSFEEGESGEIVGLAIHQASQLTREGTLDSTGAIDGEIAALHSRYVGRYVVPFQSAEVFIVSREGKLVLEIPGQQETIELLPPDDKGRWYFAKDASAAVSFIEDESGTVDKMHLHQRFMLPRKAD